MGSVHRVVAGESVGESVDAATTQGLTAPQIRTSINGVANQDPTEDVMARTYITNTEYDAPREYFDIEKATQWQGRREWDGSNMADVNVGANAGQLLYRTAGGRWVLHSWSAWQGAPDSYEWVDDEKAQEWLLFNQHDEDAAKYFGPAAEERAVGRPEIGGRVCVRLGEHLASVDEYATERGISRADAVRSIISDYFATV